MIRQKRTTVFVCVEGDSEEAFIKFIRKKYSRGKTYITVENAYGGSPDVVAEIAIKSISRLDVSHKIVWFDDDKDLSKEWEEQLKSDGFTILRSNPCLEGELFQILGEEKKYRRNQAKRCKKDFQRKYLNERTCLEIDDCEKLFDKIFLPGHLEFPSEVITHLVKIASKEKI